MTDPSAEENVPDRYRRLATRMTTLIGGVPDNAWSRTTPCEEWTVRDLVGHLVEAHGRFQSLVGRSLEEHPAVADDPAGAWTVARDQMQADLDDPVRRDEEYDGRFGRARFADSVDGFIGFDLVVHGWDLARATGQDETIEPADVARVQQQVDRMVDTMRENGVVGEAVEPAPDASAQDRLLNALGRRTA